MPKTVDDLLAALAELERGMTLDAVEQVVEGFDFERVGPAMTARRYGVTLHFERHLNSPRLDAPEDFTLLEIEVRCRRDTLLRRDPPLGADVERELSDGDLRLRVAPGGRVLGLRLPPGVRSEVLRQVLAEHAAVQETEPTATETAPAPAHDAENERELQRRYLQRKLDRGQELLEELRRRGGGGARGRGAPASRSITAIVRHA